MKATALALHLQAVAASCHDADPAGWPVDDGDVVLESCNVVAMEVAGLAARIRASKVNDTPRPVPTVPQPPPKDPPPKEGR